MKILSLALALALTTSLRLQSQTEKIGNDLFLHAAANEQKSCTPEIKFDPDIHINSSSMLVDVYPEFIWPFDNELDSGLVLVNYADDQSGGTVKDYMGNNWTYDGHNGTDISLHNFRAMDRFWGVKAAAPGTVANIVYTNYDRNTDCTGDGNYVLIRHDDGSYASYYHLMKNSVTVKIGEYVPLGRIIAYTGSSGCSSDPHLHFEPGRFINSVWTTRDPWNGTFNTLPTCWENQYGYVGNRDIKAHDMGIFTQDLVGGNMNNAGPSIFRQGILQPVTVSGNEPKIGVWILMQGRNTGTPFKIEIRKPNGNLFSQTTYSINANWRYLWMWWTPNFNAGVAETGQWYARILYNNTEQKRVYFDVQLLTSHRPRLYPVAGKCFRTSVSVQRDTLRVRPVRTNMEYELVNAPSNVTLSNDSILTISPDTTQLFRVREFKVIANIGGSSTLRDTLIYKLIDPSKNHQSGISIDMTVMSEGLWSGSSMVNDTFSVYLRASLSPYNIVDVAKAKFNSQGFGIVNFLNANGGLNYYIVVKHRNSIETWTQNVQMLQSGQPNAYNFSTAAAQAYGNNLKLKGGEWCIFSGDVNQDAVIDALDLGLVDDDAFNFETGYIDSDINGDNVTDAADLGITDTNASDFVSRERP